MPEILIINTLHHLSLSLEVCCACAWKKRQLERHFVYFCFISSSFDFFIPVVTLCEWSFIDVRFPPSGFPSAVLQKMQEIHELSSETSSSLSVCLGFFSRQEGVSVWLPVSSHSVRFLSITPLIISILQSTACSRTQVIVQFPSNDSTQRFVLISEIVSTDLQRPIYSQVAAEKENIFLCDLRETVSFKDAG